MQIIWYKTKFQRTKFSSSSLGNLAFNNMKLLLLQIVLGFATLFATTFSMKYRIFEIQLAIGVFKLLENGNGKLTPHEGAAKYVSRLTVAGNTDSRRDVFSALLEKLILAGKNLDASDEASEFFRTMGLDMPESNENNMTTWDMVKIFDPKNSAAAENNKTIDILLTILFLWADVNGNASLTYGEFKDTFLKELKALPKAVLRVVFKEITQKDSREGCIKLPDLLNHCTNFKFVLWAITFNKVNPYEGYFIQAVANFFQELDNDDGKPGDGSLSAYEAERKYCNRLRNVNALKEKDHRVSNFESWIESFVKASRDNELVSTFIEGLSKFPKIPLWDKVFGKREMVIMLDPFNSSIVASYELKQKLVLVLFAWMDLNGDNNVSMDEFVRLFLILIPDASRAGVEKMFKEIIAEKKGSIKQTEWAKHNDGFWNAASRLSQQAVISAA